MKTNLLIEILGWVGSVEILLAYGLNSYQKIRSDSAWFYLLNLTGGILMIIYTVYKEAWANTFVNIVWVLIALIAIVKFSQAKRSSHTKP